MSNDLNIDVRAYPVENPVGSTVAFASVTFCVGETPVSAINGIRVVESEKGTFVAMPQIKDSSGNYKDVAFPVMKGLRGNISKAVLKELDATINEGIERSSVPHISFGAKLPENESSQISVEAEMKAIQNPRNSTFGYGSVTFKVDDKPFAVIDNVRVMNSAEKGLFVTMPQSQDKNGEYHDIAFPVMKGLREHMTAAVMEGYEKNLSERSVQKSTDFKERIAAGKEKSEVYKKQAAQKPAPARVTTKKGVGLGD